MQISCNNCQFELDNGILQVNFKQINSGDFVLIIGRNGSGKSSLAKALAKQLYLKNGQFNHNFNNLALISNQTQQEIIDKYLREFNNDALFFEKKTALDIILEPEISKKSQKSVAVKLDPAQIIDFCQQLEISKQLLEQDFLTLSTGQMRKILLAKTLLRRPQLGIFDEPLEGLDINSRQLWLEAIKNNCETVIFITNRANQALTKANLVGQIDNLILTEIKPKDEFELLISSQKNSQQQLPKAPTLGGETYNSSSIIDENLVKLSNIIVKYGDKIILDKLNFTLKQGQNYWIKGENGAGKSTMLELITGDQPQLYANDVTIFGQKRGQGESIWQIKQQIGYLSSKFHQEYRVNCPAIEVIISGFLDSIGIYNNIADEYHDLALSWLERLDLTKYANTPFRSLPFGIARLILIIRAMVKHPKILILDEPLHGLDPINRATILNFIDQMIKNSQTSLLFVSHCTEDIPSAINNIFEFSPKDDKTGYNYLDYPISTHN